MNPFCEAPCQGSSGQRAGQRSVYVRPFTMMRQTLGCTREISPLVCRLQSPLLIGCDLRTASSEILSILGNSEVIAVNQGE